MPGTEPLIRDVSETARWVAMYRALESERPDALFKDPFARRLAGPRGEELLAKMPRIRTSEWGLTIRTLLIDELIHRALREGADLVLNLAAGLDARPYRMELPSSLRWIEVDLPGILEEKEQTLANEKPVCSLERVRLDLSDFDQRRALFERVGCEARRALVITEGLLLYLRPQDVAALARDLATPPGFRFWILDLASPAVLRMYQRAWAKQMARSPMHFAPPEGVGFFTPYGWQALEVRSMIKEAARVRRLGLLMRLLALLPESQGRPTRGRWRGICLFERRQPPG